MTKDEPSESCRFCGEDIHVRPCPQCPGTTAAYRTIVADPPWSYRQTPGRIVTSAASLRTKPDFQYERMEIEAIATMPVGG